jgi:Gluconate 2-dehydrogenase subunit 3
MGDRIEKKASDGNRAKSGLSRRKWLIDVGKATALVGIAGKAVPFEAASAASFMGPETGPEKLPLGLYRPSYDHLGAALGDESRFHPVPPACEVDFIRPRKGPFEPQFFSPDEYKVIHWLTALMLGEPSAASGKGANPSDENIVDEVAEWIDLRTYSFAAVRHAAERLTPEQIALASAYNGARLLHRIKSLDPQQTYREGLAWIAEESERRHLRGFIEIAEEQQTAILDLISDEHTGMNANAGTRFFRQIKGDIISAFYTSRTGLKELDDKANRFYAKSPGCSSSSRDRPGPRR